MKFNPTWTQIALLMVLLGSVVLTNIFAPGVVGAVTSMVSTVFGALFVNLRDTHREEIEAAKNGNARPDLTVLPGGKDGAP